MFSSQKSRNSTGYSRAIANVSASQTDSSIISAVTGKRIIVHQLFVICGDTATDITFNTKGAGAGVAITSLIENGANSGEVLPFSEVGWFETVAGEGLTATTSAGSATGINITYSIL